MLSHKVLTRQDVGRAASYYEDSADDYYAKEGDASEWQGNGAAALGLEGPVDAKRFRELLGGQVVAGEAAARSDTRHDSNARIGIDFTFSAPKSVSMQALIAGDGAIIRAHDRAVAKAMQEAEKRAQARRKEKGISSVETTGNLIVAKFRHETSREKDPQLHTHAVIMNLTQRSDGQWRALKNDELLKMNKFLGSVYRAELALELQKAGYTLRMERDGLFELANITRQQLEGFSQRAAQIEDRLAAKGLSRETATTEQKQQATMETRSRKTATERDEVFKDWQDRAKDLGIDFASKGWAGIGAAEKGAASSDAITVPADVAASQSVRWAVNHLTERQSVMTEHDLLDVALRHGMGVVSVEHITKEVQQQRADGYLIRGEPLYAPADQVGRASPASRKELIAHQVEKGDQPKLAQAYVEKAIAAGQLVITGYQYTTQTALTRERTILQAERRGREQVAPVMAQDRARDLLSSTTLNQGQRGAAELMLTTNNRVVGIQGWAGVGKSHMLDTAKPLIEQEGYTVRALAPYGAQVKALRELGVESNTLASFLKAKDKKIDDKTVLVVDEAGVIPTRLMEQLLAVAEKHGSRVVLMGDVAQTKAIEAGRPFDQLQSNGMSTAKVEEIQRQRNETLKEAVVLAAQGKSSLSVSRLENVAELREALERHQQIAKDYVALSPAERERTLIITGTNQSRREINGYLREEIGLTGKGREFVALLRRDSTQAERRFAKYYRPGDIIQPEKSYKSSGLERGQLYTVLELGQGNRLILQNSKGEQLAINPQRHAALSIYRPEKQEYAPGDILRVTKNDAKLDLANGDRFVVEKVDGHKLTLRGNNRQLEIDTQGKPVHLDYAYVSTAHSSQGLTADRALINVDTKSRTTGQDVYYVGISRARDHALIYTDDHAKLPAAVSREAIKHAALDLDSRHQQRLQREQEQQKAKGTPAAEAEKRQQRTAKESQREARSL